MRVEVAENTGGDWTGVETNADGYWGVGGGAEFGDHFDNVDCKVECTCCVVVGCGWTSDDTEVGVADCFDLVDAPFLCDCVVLLPEVVEGLEHVCG